jgi:hypothetical protein
MTKALAALILFTTLLSTGGCATGKTVAASDWSGRYTKPGVTGEQLQTDGLECHWAKGEKVDAGTAYWVGGLIGLIGGVPTAEAHTACMQAKGYTAKTTTP